MKFLRVLLLAFAAVFFIVSCEKEYSIEDETTASAGSLKSDAFGDCLPSSVNGIYKADSVLGTGNYIEVQVNVTTTGNYSIVSDTVNGYYFKGGGAFITVGLNTVKLQAVGKPLNAGSNDFIISYNGTECFINVTVIAANANIAAFTLGGSPGTCTGATASGTYTQNVALTTANTLTLTVNVTSTGAYTIGAASTNGMFFTSAGSFSSLGPQNVVLNGSGTPTTSGSITVTAGNLGGTCSFVIPVLPAGGGTTAVYTLGGAPGNCTGVVLAGTYQASVAATTANTATIDVNVTTVGSYSITTAVVNGISFSALGSFTSLGPQSVTLTATGIPSAAGPFNYAVTANANTCSFSVTYTPGTAPTNFIQCKINGASTFTTFNANATAVIDNSLGFPALNINGESTAGADPSIDFGFAKITGGTIGTGTYTVNQFASGILLGAYYYNAASTEFLAETDITGVTQTPAFTIIISSINATRVTGTFSGPLKDNAGVGPGTITITEGSFSVAF